MRGLINIEPGCTAKIRIIMTGCQQQIYLDVLQSHTGGPYPNHRSNHDLLHSRKTRRRVLPMIAELTYYFTVKEQDDGYCVINHKSEIERNPITGKHLSFATHNQANEYGKGLYKKILNPPKVNYDP